MNYEQNTILTTYSLKEFYHLNKKKLREIYKYVPDEYGVPTLKRFLLFKKTWVGFGESCINTPLNEILKYPDNYQIIKCLGRRKSPLYRITVNHDDYRDMLGVS